MRTIIFRFTGGAIEVFEGDGQKNGSLSICFVNSPSAVISDKIRNRVRAVQSILDQTDSGLNITLSTCEAVARDELEEAYVNGLSGKGKPRG